MSISENIKYIQVVDIKTDDSNQSYNSRNFEEQNHLKVQISIILLQQKLKLSKKRRRPLFCQLFLAGVSEKDLLWRDKRLSAVTLYLQ